LLLAVTLRKVPCEAGRVVLSGTAVILSARPWTVRIRASLPEP
jgi:hypothetical protein